MEVAEVAAPTAAAEPVGTRPLDVPAAAEDDEVAPLPDDEPSARDDERDPVALRWSRRRRDNSLYRRSRYTDTGNLIQIHGVRESERDVK